jgi:hypothetical protein
MSDGNDTRDGVKISYPVFYGLLVAATGGGLGVGGFVAPQAERSALEACYDNSKTALEVVAQHGQEFIDLKKYVDDRTFDRYTRDDALREQRNRESEEELQNRRLDWCEARLQELGRFHRLSLQSVPEDE